MRYRDLAIQTLRDAPNNARTPGFALLVRAGYLTRENQPTALGQHTLAHLSNLQKDLGEGFFSALAIPTIRSEDESFYAIKTGSIELLHCPSCGYADRGELARSRKEPLPKEQPLAPEKVETPECHTIEALANFLGVPPARTAKAMLFTRHSDEKLVFAILRGDMQLSLAKLEGQVGKVSLASEKEISTAGAVPGYASPIGLKDALIIVDDLIPGSSNLVAGANEAGFHQKNVNYGRDYQAERVCDLALAKAGEACATCGSLLEASTAERLAAQDEYEFLEILHAVAETHHDERGLVLPLPVAPFVVYLMHVPGKTMDTRAAGEEIYTRIQDSEIPILFDDRDERAGVKFNDADLIGCPLRITVGEKSLADGMVELKSRAARESTLQRTDHIREVIQAIMN